MFQKKKDIMMVYKHLPPKIYDNIMIEDRGLFGYLLPIISEISSLVVQQDPSKDYDKTSQDYLASYIERAPSLLGYLDLNFNFIAASRLLNEIVKYIYRIDDSSYTLTSKNIAEVFPIMPDEVKNSLQDNLIGKNAKHERIKLKYPLRDGAWIRWESFPWYSQNGSILGIVLFCEDVTSTHELFLNNHRLYSRAELLENFSLIFSHDLIQPLRQISTYTSFLELELDDSAKKNKAIQENLESLNRCITKAREICEGIILYCKNGDLTINKEPVKVSEVMDVTVKCCSTNPDILIHNLTDKNLILYANKACILQLFQNLIDNAIKHSSTPSIEITLTGKPLKNNYYEFSIHNNGWCSEALEQNRVFDAFYSDNSNGSGLGLMICKKIVTAHGGNINFISSEEEGTKISFSLPLFPSDDAEG